jgi:hypothetical protein
MPQMPQMPQMPTPQEPPQQQQNYQSNYNVKEDGYVYHSPVDDEKLVVPHLHIHWIYLSYRLDFYISRGESSLPYHSTTIISDDSSLSLGQVLAKEEQYILYMEPAFSPLVLSVHFIG